MASLAHRKLNICNYCDFLHRTAFILWFIFLWFLLFTEQKLAEELGMPFIETSARTADNVEAAFVKMARELIKARCVRAWSCEWPVNIRCCISPRGSSGFTGTQAT